MLGLLTLFGYIIPEQGGIAIAVVGIVVGGLFLLGGFYSKFGNRNDLLPLKTGETLQAIAFFFLIIAILLSAAVVFLEDISLPDHFTEINFIIAVGFGGLLFGTGYYLEKTASKSSTSGQGTLSAQEYRARHGIPSNYVLRRKLTTYEDGYKTVEEFNNESD